MNALAQALLNELGEDDLRELADRLRPYLEPTTELLTPEDAAAHLGLHRKTVVRAAAAGRVPGARRVGRAWRFDRDLLTVQPPAGVPPAPPVVRQRPRNGDTASAIRSAKTARTPQ